MMAKPPGSILYPSHFKCTRAAAHRSEVPDTVKKIAGADVREPQRLCMRLQELFRWHRLRQVYEEDRVRKDRLRHGSRVVRGSSPRFKLRLCSCSHFMSMIGMTDWLTDSLESSAEPPHRGDDVPQPSLRLQQ